ncbi:zinc finger MYM-type protein 6-like [Macrobrachium rosenbergii]|uniref:zinc finger MYM-type protein 6-like n=1 Tax=Macrobrachium rosenbergii TaxID=79674 RepID=UPI0034D45CBD
MIDTLACMVKEEIAEKVRSCHYFSVQADEAKDVSKAEQLALVIRFYDEIANCIQECFISFTQMDLLDAASITDIILKSLDKLGLDYKSSLVGLGFDGASVMSGGISGVQKRIRDKAPLHIIYTAMDTGSI